jgi:hypothetical protein
MDTPQFIKDMGEIAFQIGELAIDHPQMNNDLEWFKTLYNRQLDENLNKRKEN